MQSKPTTKPGMAVETAVKCGLIRQGLIRAPIPRPTQPQIYTVALKPMKRPAETFLP